MNDDALIIPDLPLIHKFFGYKRCNFSAACVGFQVKSRLILIWITFKRSRHNQFGDAQGRLDPMP